MPWARRKSLHVAEGRDPEAELRDLQRRFRAFSNPRGPRLLRLVRAPKRTMPFAIPVTVFLIVFGLVLGLFQLNPGTKPTPHFQFQPNPATTHTLHFQNCDAARAAGVAPIRRGRPGYARHLDRDNDGIACEPWPR
jgi:hypothetical protein